MENILFKLTDYRVELLRCLRLYTRNKMDLHYWNLFWHFLIAAIFIPAVIILRINIISINRST